MLEPRVLLSIDYESWVAIRQQEYNFAPSSERKLLDDGYTQNALDEILDILRDVSISIYLIGEIADWYPDVPKKIFNANHELGFHGRVHRPIAKPDDLKMDIAQSIDWIKKFGVKGYRAPIAVMPHQGYKILSETNIVYSSSIYGPTGYVQNISGIWEVPISTWAVRKKEPVWWWPRSLTLRLLAQGEIPYGSSFFTGLLGEKIFFFIEKELRMGRSPVVVFHNYQIVVPVGWPMQIRNRLRENPLLWIFTSNQKKVLKRLIREYPVGTTQQWLSEWNIRDTSSRTNREKSSNG